MTFSNLAYITNKLAFWASREILVFFSLRPTCLTDKILTSFSTEFNEVNGKQ
jgi:hypothetical protein